MPSGPCQYSAFRLVEKAAGERGKLRTSATSSAIRGESHAGGAAGLNSFGAVIRKGFHPVAVTLAGLVPIQKHLPVGTEPVQTASEPSLRARSTIRSATLRPRSSPAV